MSSTELRRIVKNIHDEPLFSTRWFNMLSALQRITDVAVGESQQTGEAKGDKTLWERNELIVRFLLEEGKLNFALRVLVQFKDMQRNEMFSQALQDAQAKEPGAAWDDIPTIKIKAALFEQTLGVLLSCALASVEALQTLDLPLLLEHIHRTLTFSLVHSEMVRSPDSVRRQEVLCVTYLSHIFDQIDQLNEDRIMDLIQQHSLLPLLVRNIHLYHTFYTSSTKIHAGKAVSGILGSEAFKTSPDSYLTEVDLKKVIVSLEASFVKETFTDFSSKKQVRGLLDAISRFKYQLPKE